MIALVLAGTALAQGGPPMRTDDPGTLGNRNWEVNFASTLESGRTERVTEAPLFDMNYGLCDRLQLKLESTLGSTNQGTIHPGVHR